MCEKGHAGGSHLHGQREHLATPAETAELEKCSAKAKESAAYAVDLIKLYITFATGGIGFIATLVYADHGPRISLEATECIMAYLGISILLGAWAYGCLIRAISQENDYRIYNCGTQLLALLQLFFFASACVTICWNGYTVLSNAAKGKAGPMEGPAPVVSDGAKDLRGLPAGAPHSGSGSTNQGATAPRAAKRRRAQSRSSDGSVTGLTGRRDWIDCSTTVGNARLASAIRSILQDVVPNIRHRQSQRR